MFYKLFCPYFKVRSLIGPGLLLSVGFKLHRIRGDRVVQSGKPVIIQHSVNRGLLFRSHFIRIISGIAGRLLVEKSQCLPPAPRRYLKKRHQNSVKSNLNCQNRNQKHRQQSSEGCPVRPQHKYSCQNNHMNSMLDIQHLHQYGKRK